MKILILGSSGILGYKLVSVLRKKFKIYHNGLRSRKFNLNKKNLTYLINQTNPDFIINCVAITDIELCEKKKHNCKSINTDLVKNIFDIKKKYKFKFKLIHFSTDQMYDNFSLRSCNENSIPYVNNYYTKTKIMSEKICLKNNSLVFRINFFGNSKKGMTFSKWVISKFNSKKNFYLVNDVYFNPLSLNTIGKIIYTILNKNLYIPGIFNLGAKDKISKKMFALKLAKLLNIFHNNFETKKINDIVHTKRSNNMFMNIKKFEKKFKIKLPKILNEIKSEIRYKKI